MTSPAWMPFYVGDYLKDTSKLRTIEHGAYLLLIMEYWVHGGLEDDDEVLARVARMSPDEWVKARPRLRSLFGEGWRHKRIDAELEKAQGKSERRAIAGAKGGAAKAAAQQRAHPPDSIARDLLGSLPQQKCGIALASSSESDPPSSSGKEDPKQAREEVPPPAAAEGLDLEDLERRCCEAAGFAESPEDFHVIVALVNAGASVERRVLPAIRAAKLKRDRRKVRQTEIAWWRYFEGPIADWSEVALVQPRAPPAVATRKIWVPFESAPWKAWCDQYRRLKRPAPTPIRSVERGQNGAWFDTEYPPDEPKTKAATA